MPGPRILILYSRTGGGHGRVAQTLQRHLLEQEPGAQISLVDGLECTDLGVRVDPARAFLKLTTTFIHLYNLNYRVTNTRPTVPLLRWLIRQNFGRTLARVIRDTHPDLVISTHHFISPSTIVQRHSLPPFFMVVSDLGQPHRIWFDPHIHSVYVPSDEMAAYARTCLDGHVSTARVEMRGFPIETAEATLHEPNPHSAGLLVMGGGAGTGGVDRVVRALARDLPDHRIVVVCGWNERLKRTIESWNRPNVETHGFIQHVPELMSQADIVISKAGPVTIMEAVAAGRPLLITDWVGLQEEDNVSFVVDHGLGLYCSDPARLSDRVREIYADYDRFLAAKPRNVEHGPERIAAHILETWRTSLDPA